MQDSKQLTAGDLRQFTGSEQWYRHGIVRDVLFTDGAKFVADRAGAYWLLDEIALAQRFQKSVAGRPGRGLLAARRDRARAAFPEECCRRGIPTLEADGQSRPHRYARLRGRQRQRRLQQANRVHGFSAPGDRVRATRSVQRDRCSLRGERDHCKMAAIPSFREEDAKRPSRERESLVGEQSRLVNRMKATLIRLGIRGFNPKLRHAEQQLEALRTPEGEPIPPNTLAELKRDMQRRRFICDQIRSIEQERLERLERTPDTKPHAMVRLLARVTGIGIETADLLVHELLLRNMRDRRAVARYGGLTGSPDRSGATSREKGMARSGNARVRRGMVQLAWRFLLFQKDSALAQWYRQRTEKAPKARKTMIVALARKLLIALWRLVREGVISDKLVRELVSRMPRRSCRWPSTSAASRPTTRPRP